MITGWIKYLLASGVILILGLSACQSTGTEVTPTVPIPTITVNLQSKILATPYAQKPAAGICGGFEAEMVVITLYPDIPDPRCSKVREDQKLTIINQTQNTLEVSIGMFTTKLEPGGETIIDTPFGEYLAPGVHHLQVSPCCGPELWLEGK